MNRLRVIVSDNRWLLVFAASVALAFALLRSEPSQLTTEAALEAAISSGEPAIVYLYSNF